MKSLGLTVLVLISINSGIANAQTADLESRIRAMGVKPGVLAVDRRSERWNLDSAQVGPAAAVAPSGPPPPATTGRIVPDKGCKDSGTGSHNPDVCLIEIRVSGAGGTCVFDYNHEEVQTSLDHKQVEWRLIGTDGADYQFEDQPNVHAIALFNEEGFNNPKLKVRGTFKWDIKAPHARKSTKYYIIVRWTTEDGTDLCGIHDPTITNN